MRAWTICYSNICDYKSTSSLRTVWPPVEPLVMLPTVTLAILFLLRILLFSLQSCVQPKMAAHCPPPPPPLPLPALDFAVFSSSAPAIFSQGKGEHLFSYLPFTTFGAELSLWLLSLLWGSLSGSEACGHSAVSVAPTASLHTRVYPGVSFRSISALLTPRPLSPHALVPLIQGSDLCFQRTSEPL